MCVCLKVLPKIILLIVNVAVILLGILLIATGSLLVVFRSSLSTVPIAINNDIVAIAIIGTGCVVCLVAFCGCCGAIADSGCLLITYAVFTFLLAAFNIVLAVTLITNKEYVNSTFGETLENVFQTSPDNFQSIEYIFKCCGTTGVDSYAKIEMDFPATCCRNFSNIITDIDMIDINDIKDGFCSEDQTYGGCLNVFQVYVAQIVEIVFIIFIVFVSIQLLVAISAIILGNAACGKSKGRVIDQRSIYPAQYRR